MEYAAEGLAMMVKRGKVTVRTLVAGCVFFLLAACDVWPFGSDGGLAIVATTGPDVVEVAGNATFSVTVENKSRGVKEVTGWGPPFGTLDLVVEDAEGGFVWTTRVPRAGGWVSELEPGGRVTIDRSWPAVRQPDPERWFETEPVDPGVYTVRLLFSGLVRERDWNRPFELEPEPRTIQVVPGVVDSP